MLWISIVFMIVGLIGICWPLPLFILPSDLANFYLKLLVDIEKDKSAGSALPFFWLFFTLPIGTILVIVFFLIYCAIKNYCK